MRRILPRVLFLFLLPIYFTSYSQNLTGIWRGYFITEDHDEYKFELQIEQKGNSISGVSYSYLTTVFYGKATLTGNFSRNSSSTMIQEIKTVELRMSESSVACIMKCMFEYSRSGKEEFMEGFYTSKFEKNDTVFGLIRRKGADCGGGKVFLRKVTTSDFYVEPFLRDKIGSDSLLPKKIPIKKVEETKKPPVISKPITKATTPPVKKPVVKPSTGTNKNINTSTTNTPAKKVDSIAKITPPDVKKEITVKPFSSSDALKYRENELVKTLTVTDPNVIVKLYDNGEIDGDSISVYMDKKLILEHQLLKASPILIKLQMDEDNAEHELVMVAENLGRIPPNTSLMIVESGDKRYNVFITSTEKKNAVVRFKYQKLK